MRFFPLVTATVVLVTLYLLIIEREAVLAFAGVGEAADAAVTAPEAESDALIAVTAMVSHAQPVESAVLMRGRTEATRRVDVRAETSGLVRSEPLRRGAFVNQGEVLCELDTGVRAASLREAEARYAEAEINARAAERLAEGGFAAETRLLSARAALQSAEAGVEAARQELARLTMVAPFSGLLESDAAETGALLQPGGLCATIVQLDPIRLVGFVPETQVDQVEVGAPGGARLASGRELVGRVTHVARAADPATRTFRIEVTVPNPDFTIRDGQSAEILIAASAVEGHLLPASALTLDDSGRLGVRVVEPGSRVGFVPVTLLRDSHAGVWVTGPQEAAEVIVVGQEYVREGVQVRVSYRDASRPESKDEPSHPEAAEPDPDSEALP